MCLAWFKNKGYKTRLLNPVDEFYDRVLRVKTFGFKSFGESDDQPDWHCHYVPAKYQHIFAMLKHAHVGQNTVFMDFGCGMGRALFAAAHSGAKKSIGVEYDSELYQVACDNIARSGMGARVEVLCADAAQVVISDDVNLVLFFNPFGVGTLRSVLGHIEESLRRRPRELLAIYFNPIKHEAFEECASFKLLERWPEIPHQRYAIEFWLANN